MIRPLVDRGSFTKKIVPAPEVLSTVTVPPWSLITLLTIASPRPVPFDFPELTKGLNSVLRIEAGTPDPLSATRPT